jgi:hypothetical protein
MNNDHPCTTYSIMTYSCFFRAPILLDRETDKLYRLINRFKYEQ